MKRIVIGLVFVSCLLMLAGCGKTDLTQYIDVSYTGINSKGEADYSLNEKALVKDLYNVDMDGDKVDDETTKKINNLLSSYKIKIDKTSDLSNGDKIKVSVSVNPNKSKGLEEKSSKKFKVSGLKKGKRITNVDIKKHVFLFFSGANGKGHAKVETNFDVATGLTRDDFKVENNKDLKNGENVSLVMSKNAVDVLANNGFLFKGKRTSVYSVSRLENAAQNVAEINNIDYVKDMIMKSVNTRYKSSDSTSAFAIASKIHFDGFYYRGSTKDSRNSNDRDNDTDALQRNDEDGTLLGVYSVEQSVINGNKKRELIEVVGYSNILIDKYRNVDVNDINEISQVYDDTYSLKTVQGLLESYGYSAVK
ncbi:hypothetical protein HCJ66_12970 [Listeria sp. FSL L7-1582]|uniref:hypothetical protein n=1 Tax=Listeria portnoyi TaxID=2713504 RepID=UPI00164E9FB9|nr:hypothetical protein [Listeria portnoyi]MBC6310450.1 hypothetical protein [Listeria portnoyi]